MKLAASSLLCLLASSSLGCASLLARPAQEDDSTTKIVAECQAKVATFEKIVVPEAEFDSRGSSETLEAMASQSNDLEQCFHRIPDAERAKLVKRRDDARRVQAIRVARGANAIKSHARAITALKPVVGYRKSKLPPEVLTLLREAEDGRVAARDEELEATKSYAAGGKSCIFSKSPIGKPESPAPLTYRFDANTTTVYVRCFAEVDLSKLTGKQVQLDITAHGYGDQAFRAPLGVPSALPPDTRFVDAEIQMPRPEGTDADVDIYLGHVALEQSTVVGQVFEQGVLKPRWGSTVLAKSAYLWER